jgi:dsDNA-specific endonuclease/ATPase MutS2
MGHTKRNKHKNHSNNNPAGDIATDRKRVLLYQVDLHGLTWEEAQPKLRAAHREALHKGSRLLKIIHGYGKNTGSNVLQVAVRGWLARNPFPFRAAIPGEAYNISDPTTTELRAEIGDFPDNDLNATNQGMTLVWLK